MQLSLVPSSKSSPAVHIVMHYFPLNSSSSSLHTSPCSTLPQTPSTMYVSHYSLMEHLLLHEIYSLAYCLLLRDRPLKLSSVSDVVEILSILDLRKWSVHCKKFGVCDTPNTVCYHVLYTHTFFGVQCTPLHKVCLAYQPRCVSHTYYSVSRTPTTVCLAHQPRCVSHAYYSVSLTPTMACPTHTYYGVSCTPTIVCHVRF